MIETAIRRKSCCKKHWLGAKVKTDDTNIISWPSLVDDYVDGNSITLNPECVEINRIVETRVTEYNVHAPSTRRSPS